MSETATLALGCFWGPDDYFSQLSGVLSTTVGYSGGTKDNPTYTNLGDHSETIEIKFDSEVISYKELIELFFKKHDPTAVQSSQYKSVIFTHNEKQQQVAEEEKISERVKRKRQIITAIVPASPFYKAEEYHQKYLAKARGEIKM